MRLRTAGSKEPVKTANAALAASIRVTIATLAAGNAALFLFIAIAQRFSPRLHLVFFACGMPYWSAMALTLLALRDHFRLDTSGERLARVNAATVVTLCRLSAVPLVLTLILASKDYPIRWVLAGIVAAVFASDFVDGLIARSLHQTTSIGRILDPASDYVVLILAGAGLTYYHRLSWWFLAILLVRFVGQGAMGLVLLLAKRFSRPAATLPGKIAVASAMGLFAVQAARLAVNLPSLVYSIAEIAVGTVLALSTLEKAVLLVRGLRDSGTGDDIVC